MQCHKNFFCCCIVVHEDWRSPFLGGEAEDENSERFDWNDISINEERKQNNFF